MSYAVTHTYMDQRPWNNPGTREMIGAPPDAPFGVKDAAGRLAVFRTTTADEAALILEGQTYSRMWSTLPAIPYGIEIDAPATEPAVILRAWVEPDTFAAGYRLGTPIPRAMIPTHKLDGLAVLPPEELPAHRLPVAVERARRRVKDAPEVARRCEYVAALQGADGAPDGPCQVWRVSTA